MDLHAIIQSIVQHLKDVFNVDVVNHFKTVEADLTGLKAEISDLKTQNAAILDAVSKLSIPQTAPVDLTPVAQAIDDAITAQPSETTSTPATTEGLDQPTPAPTDSTPSQPAQ